MLELRLLGCLDLRDPRGREVRSVLSHSKHLAVLSYLAVEVPGAFVRRDCLLALLWAESDTAHARNSLNQAVHALRRALGQDVLLSRGRHELSLGQSAVWSDVQAFRAAVARRDPEGALDLYGGDFLAGFHLPSAPAFDHWAGGHRLRLRRMAATAGWAVARQRLDGGDLVAAERVALGALKLVVTRECEVRAFVRALDAAGDRAAAVEFYERFRRILAEEFELEPSDDTRQVVARIWGRAPPAKRRDEDPVSPSSSELAESSERVEPRRADGRLPSGASAARKSWRRHRSARRRWPW